MLQSLIPALTLARQFLDNEMGTDSSHLGFAQPVANFRLSSLAPAIAKFSPFQHSTKWKLRPPIDLNKTNSQSGRIFKPSSGTFKHNKFPSSTRTTTEIPSRIGKLPLIFFGKINQCKQSQLSLKKLSQWQFFYGFLAKKHNVLVHKAYGIRHFEYLI